MTSSRSLSRFRSPRTSMSSHENRLLCGIMAIVRPPFLGSVVSYRKTGRYDKGAPHISFWGEIRPLPARSPPESLWRAPSGVTTVPPPSQPRANQPLTISADGSQVTYNERPATLARGRAEPLRTPRSTGPGTLLSAAGLYISPPFVVPFRRVRGGRCGWPPRLSRRVPAGRGGFPPLRGSRLTG